MRRSCEGIKNSMCTMILPAAQLRGNCGARHAALRRATKSRYHGLG